jgi:UDP-glucose 4-epimerase
MKKALITGGAGFIGSHLSDELIKKGYEVIIFDNEATGFKENINSKAKFIKGDVRNQDSLEKVFKKYKIDVVFHLAAQVSNIKSFENPEEDLNVNVGGTLNILKMCVKYKIARLLYASSMAVYGQPEKMPITEETSCVPLSYYGIGKYAAERYVINTAKRSDLGFDFQVTAFRMFNVYGERQSLDNPYQGVVSVFISNLLRNEPITLYGTGEHSRDFIHVDDIISGWIKAVDNKKSFGQVINLGIGKEISINQLIDACLAAFDKNRQNYQIIKKPTLAGDQITVRADISKAKKLLNWSPRIDFKQGMKKTIQWAIKKERGEIER